MEAKQPLRAEQRSEMREVVGVFKSVDQLQAAIDDLMLSGFDRAQISVLASEDAVREKLGREYLPVSKLEDNPDTPRTEYVSPESRNEAKAALIGGLFYLGAAGAAFATLASGGAFATAAVAGSGGAFLGAVLAQVLGLHEAIGPSSS